jgi:hypothetical protein
LVNKAQQAQPVQLVQRVPQVPQVPQVQPAQLVLPVQRALLGPPARMQPQSR